MAKKKTVSYVKNGRSHYKNVGSYNELTADAKGQFSVGKGGISKLNQNLTNDDSNSASLTIIKKARKELGW